MPKILAVDPGKATGVAVYDTADREFKSTAYETEEFYDVVESLVTWADEIVCEGYVITQATLTKSRGDNWSLELIGLLRFLCYRAGKPFVTQLPAEAMSFSTNDKLKTVGWFRKGVDHPNAAAKHLLVYVLKNKHETLKTLGLI